MVEDTVTRGDLEALRCEINGSVCSIRLRVLCYLYTPNGGMGVSWEKCCLSTLRNVVAAEPVRMSAR